jgi:hypothetical protein
MLYTMHYYWIDFKYLIKGLADRPTHANKLGTSNEDYVGYVDASAFGVGGVWFSSRLPVPPTAWRVLWPNAITNIVVSESNPLLGTIINLDLEMAGVLLHQLVLERLVDLLYHNRSQEYIVTTPPLSVVVNQNVGSRKVTNCGTPSSTWPYHAPAHHPLCLPCRDIYPQSGEYHGRCSIPTHHQNQRHGCKSYV